jgi:hypothetical protein
METVPRSVAAPIEAPPVEVRRAREEKMVIPHPVHVIMSLEQRQADFLAEIARERRARLAEQSNDPPPRRRLVNFLATLAALLVLALLIAAGVTAA